MTVLNKATVLLVGDSILRFTHPKRLAPRQERLFKVCVPGMAVNDLHTWLSSLPVSPSLNDVIIHAGINSCPSGAVSNLIALCCTSFPKARIAFSSILPARGKHSFNNAILPSNQSLKAACRQHKVIFIDHFPSFASDATLYNDTIHPNARGTARLAQNLKSLWEHRPRADHHLVSDPISR